MRVANYEWRGKENRKKRRQREREKESNRDREELSHYTEEAKRIN